MTEKCGTEEAAGSGDHPSLKQSGHPRQETDPQGSVMQGMYQCIRDSIRDAMKDATREMKKQQTIENETLRARQEEQTERLESRMQQMSDALSGQLGRVEHNQRQTKEEVINLKSQCKSLQEENKGLQKLIKLLRNKCDSLENHSRRNNLLFFGIKKEQGKEDWDDCEQKVKTVIRDGMGIAEEIAIERAHRTGRGDAVVVKLLSYKCKTLILKNSRKLKTSDKFQKVFVREDFSETVRRKRQGLRDKARQLYEAGQKTRMKFDKLITEDGVYTYDIDREVVVRVNRDREADGEKDDDKPEDESSKPSEDVEQGASGQSEQQMEWDLYTGFTQENFPSIQTGNNDNDGSSTLPFILPTAEYPHMNQANGRRATETIAPGQRSSQEAARTARRHNTSLPAHSPMKTRQRASSSSLNRKLTEKDSAHTNTLQQWVKSNNTKHQQARGGGGVQVGNKIGRGGGANGGGDGGGRGGGRGGGGGRGSGGAGGRGDDGDKSKR